ncbi:hypothetical protein FN846DRAFT_999894 [Sphaerosporella brunnea]|uniref:Uncharacterized protein n=1 Tax=Sphaerosporella brunnea TaxID=1250544 RepID=A0A5J5F5T3_9PEZI|nr:hypothetical protein FN846DRAFT_999894 [Sphaerosporella brunnea]
MSCLQTSEGKLGITALRSHADPDDWEAALWKAGLHQNVIKAILDPSFEDVRFTRSAHNWAVEAVMMRWEFLKGLEELVKSRRGVNRAGTGSGPEDPITLYKGGTMERLRKAVLQDSWDCTNILSTPPCDFSRHQCELYFTKQREVARRYCQFAIKLSKGAIDVGIMEVVVSRAWLAANTHYLVGNEWKRYVWANRKQQPLPAALGYLNAFNVLGGPVCIQAEAGRTWEDQIFLDLISVDSCRSPNGPKVVSVFKGLTFPPPFGLSLSNVYARGEVGAFEDRVGGKGRLKAWRRRVTYYDGFGVSVQSEWLTPIAPPSFSPPQLCPENSLTFRIVLTTSNIMSFTTTGRDQEKQARYEPSVPKAILYFGADGSSGTED